MVFSPRGMAEKEGMAMSSPVGERVCDGTSLPVNVFAAKVNIGLSEVVMLK